MGFTGTRFEPRDLAKVAILGHLAELHVARGFVTGGCIGVDHFVGESLVQMYPRHEHVVVVPADRSRVADWWTPWGALVKVIEMPPGTSYKQRDQRLVDECERLIGYPMYPEADDRSTRSGTWMTLRMGRRDHDVLPLFYPITHLGRGVGGAR